MSCARLLVNCELMFIQLFRCCLTCSRSTKLPFNWLVLKTNFPKLIETITIASRQYILISAVISVKSGAQWSLVILQSCLRVSLSCWHLIGCINEKLVLQRQIFLYPLFFHLQRTKEQKQNWSACGLPVSAFALHNA